MSKLTDDFIEWVLSEYHIKLTAVPSDNPDTFEKIFPYLAAMLKSAEENNE